MLGRVGQALRMAGDKVRAFDDAYATKIAELIQGKNPGVVRAALSVPPGLKLSEMGKIATLEGTPTLGEKALAAAANYGAPIASASLRYGVPTAGLIAAHKGIGDLYNLAAQTPVFGENPADVQQQNPNLLVTYV
jgi:hypothetical protein